MPKSLVGAKVLVVDNSQTIRSRMQTILDEHQVDCILAVDGLDGLAKFEENSDIAMIFCDLNMPKMDGLTMIERIVSSAKPLPPTILVTTESSTKMVERAKSLGIKGWIVKPVTAELVSELLTQLVG